MIYFLHGEDTEKSRVKLKSLLGSLFAKKPNAGFFKLDTDSFKEKELEELMGGQGLFEKKYIVQMDGLFGDKDISQILLDKLEELEKSENIFIFIEAKVNKPLLKKIEKYTSKAQEFALKDSKVRLFATEKGDFSLGEFNIFDVADAFGKRDKKNLWILYQKTRQRDIPTEEVGGIIFWQLKAMFQALQSKSPEKAGLKPFVFNKALRYAKNYSVGELKKMSAGLVRCYHEARRSGLEFDLALEKFILEL